VTVDNDLYPTASGLNSEPHITILSATVSANQPSNQPSTDGPQVGLSSSIVALIIAFLLLFFCVVCPIGTCLWIRRRHQHTREVSTDSSERVLEPGQGHSHTPSNLSEFGVEALTIQEQLSAPPTMGPNMAAAMLDARGLVGTPSRRRQPATTLPSEIAAPASDLHQAMQTARHADGEHPAAVPAGSATPSPPLVDPTERRRSRSPTAFFARLSHNFAAAFGSTPPQESAEADGDTDETSIAESYSTPMTLGVRLNHQPTATAASSTLHGSDSEGGSGKGKWLRYSVASHSAMTCESTRAPSFSSRASLGHSQGGQAQGQGGLRVRLIHPICAEDDADASLFSFLVVQRGDQSSSPPLDVVNDLSQPGSAQSGELSLSSASTGMVTALTHQTMDLT
jgi:hypothetical protein